jgi:LPXTG-motif cell wall-anchored protein
MYPMKLRYRVLMILCLITSLFLSAVLPVAAADGSPVTGDNSTVVIIVVVALVVVLAVVAILIGKKKNTFDE